MQAKEQKVTRIEILGRLLTQDVNKENLIVQSEECLATLLDLSKPGIPFNYSLYITNQDKNENSRWDKLAFQIQPQMQMSVFANKDIDVLQWVTKTNIYFLEILYDESNEINKHYFWKVLEQCLCSASKKISFERASIECQKSSIKYIRNLGQINDVESHCKYVLRQLAELRKKEEIEKELLQNMKNLRIQLPKVNSIVNTEVAKKIFEGKGELYNYDNDKEELVNLNNKMKVMLRIYKLDSQRFDYILCVETLDEEPSLLVIDQISENINGQMVQIEQGKFFFVWITSKFYTKIVGNCIGYLFDDPSDFEKFKIIFEKCKYESKTGVAYETLEEKNRKYLESARNYNNIDCFSDDEKEGENEEEEEKEEKEEKKKKFNKKKKNREEIMDLDEGYNEVESSNKEVLNKFCVDALTNDRTFCVNDNNEIVVYKSNFNDDTIEKFSSLPVIKEYKGKNVILNKGLLYKSEQNMLLLDENNPYVLYQYDLPKGKIVSEWNTDKTKISDICSLKRNGQTTDEKVIYGVNPKSIFTLDERVNNKNNIGEIKTYQTKNFANKIISSGEGQFVTGGEKGDLRFYDRIGIKAKNLMSLYGDPIRHIDISSDDQYLLLTCDKYLLLINVNDLKGESSAFKKTIKLEERRGPLTLQIKTKDIAKYELQNAVFTSARFDHNESGLNNIITSLGEYIIIWNYNDIRKGKVDKYKIQKTDDLIIDNYFKVGKGNRIIVGMPTKMRIQNLKKIK